MTQDIFFVACATDSLSMARPWNYKKENLDPELATKFTDSYPYLLKKKLDNLFTNREVIVNNFANRGSLIGSAAAKARDLFSWLKADINIFHFCVVDCWLRGENLDTQTVPIEEFEKHFTEMVNLKQELNSTQPSIFIGICPTNAHTLSKNPHQNEEISKYNNCMQKLIHSIDNTDYIDMEKFHHQHGDSILHPDGHNYSILGHQIVADTLFSVIERVAFKQNLVD